LARARAYHEPATHYEQGRDNAREEETRFSSHPNLDVGCF
jgi:hypothetical protein